MVKCCNGECDCHHEFRARRKDGAGTYVKPGTPLSKNEEFLLGVFKEAIKVRPYGCTRRQISAHLFATRNPVPPMESGKSWDAHYVQATMSRLVGRGVVNSRKMDRGNALLYTLPVTESQT